MPKKSRHLKGSIEWARRGHGKGVDPAEDFHFFLETCPNVLHG